MLLARPATLIWRHSANLFWQYPNRTGRIFFAPSFRCTSQDNSSLPEKKDEAEPEIELTAPKGKWDPVPQKFLKKLRVEHHGIEPANFNDSTIWQPIYKFPYLHMVRNFVRVKVYVTSISVAVCLHKLANALMHAEGTLGYAFGVSGVTLFGMYLAGNLCRKLIVHMYVTGDLEHVRFTRFTFFGRRQDIVLPRSCVLPLTDTNASHRKLVLNVRTKSPENVDLTYDNYEFYDENFNIIVLFGGINDMEKFETFFGRILRRIA